MEIENVTLRNSFLVYQDWKQKVKVYQDSVDTALLLLPQVSTVGTLTYFDEISMTCHELMQQVNRIVLEIIDIFAGLSIKASQEIAGNVHTLIADKVAEIAQKTSLIPECRDSHSDILLGEYDCIRIVSELGQKLHELIDLIPLEILLFWQDKNASTQATSA